MNIAYLKLFLFSQLKVKAEEYRILITTFPCKISTALKETVIAVVPNTEDQQLTAQPCHLECIES